MKLMLRLIARDAVKGELLPPSLESGLDSLSKPPIK